MLAIAFLFFFAVYLLISAGFAGFAMRRARKHGIEGWKWGLPVFLFMLGLIFWDWLPMEISYRHLCSSDAGYTQYKSLDEWKRENPGVAETLRPIENPPWNKQGNLVHIPLNQRFAWEIITTPHWFHIVQRDERVIATKTGVVMAGYVDFSTDIPPIGIGGDSLGDYKIWMMKRSCEVGQTMPEQIKFNGFKGIIEDIGKDNGH